MTRRWVREELKKNEVATIMNKALNFYFKYKEKVQIAGIVLGIIILITTIYFYRQKTIVSKYLENLDLGQQYLRAGIYDEAIKSFEKAKEGSKTVASYAFFYESEAYLQKKEYDKASGILISNLDVIDKRIKPIVLYQVAKIFELAQNYDNSIQYYQMLINDYPEHYYIADSYSAIARIKEIQNKVNEALSNYEKVVGLFPGTIYKEYAQSRIDFLKNTNLPQTNLTK